MSEGRGPLCGGPLESAKPATGVLPLGQYKPALQARADEAWSEADQTRLTLHDGRHTYASLMIAAGVNAKALQTFMGHANISITLDRYGPTRPAGPAKFPPAPRFPWSSHG